MQCDTCGREAVVHQIYSGQHLCRQHFILDLESKAKRAIRTHRWMVHGDHIAIALSGDAQGYALLIFLKKLTAQRRDVHISAITIDTGDTNLPVECAIKMAESEGIPCYAGSFKDTFGVTMGEIEREKGPVVCQQYRKVLCSALLNRIAREHRCTKIAYGFTVDDGACDVLERMMTGTVEQMLLPHRAEDNFLPSIVPFMQVPEKEVRSYAELHGGTFCPHPCISPQDSLHNAVKTMLEAYDHNHPATRFALVNLKENLAGAASGHTDGIATCPHCGAICVDGICGECRIRREFVGSF